MESKFPLLSLVAPTLIFIACNKKDDVKSEIDATISVAIKSADLRAYKGSAGTTDMQAKTLVIIVYEGQAQIVYEEATTAGDLEAKGVETTASTRTLFVVASFEGIDFQGKSLNDTLTTTHELGTDDQDPVKGKYILTSDATPVTPKKGKNFYGYADGGGNHISDDPIQLKHIRVGMSFTDIKVDFAAQYKDLYDAKFDKGAIMALIARKQSNVSGASLVNVDPNHLCGERHFGQVDSKYILKVSYKETVELKMTITRISETTTGEGFYMLENNSAEYPTILCIKGELTQEGGAAPTVDQAKEAVAAGWIVSKTDHSAFYPVLVSWEKDSYTFIGTTDKKGIIRNNRYEISPTITGPGTNSPEKPAQEKASLDVVYKVTP